jgi:putative protein-disulfide isomerase
VIQKFEEKYRNEVDFWVLSGGMVTGSRIGAIGKVAPYISYAYKDVEKATGVQFGDGFLNGVLAKGTNIFSSVPPAVALCVFKSYQEENSILFAARLQKAIYYDGVNLEDYEVYGRIASEFATNADEFVARMKESSFIKASEAEFALVASWGVRGFPTVFLLENNTLYPLTSGYIPFEQLEERFMTAKKSLKNS